MQGYVEGIQQGEDLLTRDMATGGVRSIPAGTHMGAMVNVLAMGERERRECGKYIVLIRSC